MFPRKQIFPFIRQSRGNALIDFAVILPILLMLSLLGIEYGWYFMHQLEANRRVGVAVQLIKLDPRTAVRPAFSAGFFNGTVCARASTGTFGDNVGCGGGWQTVPNNPNAPAYSILVQAAGNFQSLTGVYDALLPNNVSAREVVPIGGGCSYQAYLRHRGCRVTYRERRYRCNGRVSGQNAAPAGFQRWGDWSPPVCDGGNRWTCPQRGTITLDPGPHMCSSRHPPCPSCSGSGSTEEGWGTIGPDDGSGVDNNPI
jgi:TadE-like protein.